MGSNTPGTASSAADFFSILKGLGRVLGGQNGRKIEILSIFWICLWRPYFWSNFVRFLIKSMAKNIGIFSEFSTPRFINCFLNLLISSMLETSNIVFFAKENAYFIKSHFSRSMLKGIEHAPKANGVGRRKDPKN